MSKDATINEKKSVKLKVPAKRSNKIKDTVPYRVFTWCNNIFLIVLALVCLLPMVQVFAQSLSHDMAIKTSKVFLLPVNASYDGGSVLHYYPMSFNWDAYKFLLSNSAFWVAFWIAIQRVILGTLLNMFMCITVAYPLSQNTKKFPARTPYVWFFFFTMLFGGGLIPGYYVVERTGLMNSMWALIIPGCVPVYNCILMLNFFRQLPKELDEAAFMDGAGHWTILFKIYLPTSLPSIATIALFTIVGHWNDWFAGLLYLRSPEKYPLQTYLQTIITQQDPAKLKQIMGNNADAFKGVSTDNLIAAQIFVGAAPILMVYPFLQKYFAKGIVLGSVKG